MVRAWLPQQALAAGAVEGMLESLLDGWSRKWFARRPMRASGGLARRTAGEPEGERLQWNLLDDGFAIGTSAAGRAAIAAAMLDLGKDEQLVTPADAAIAELLADECLEDLRDRVSHLLRTAPDRRWQPAELLDPSLFDQAYCVGVGNGVGRPAIRLAIAADLFVAIVKLAIRSAPMPILLRPMAEALRRQPVEVAAFVGAAELPLSQVAALVPGDVLVLDSLVEAPLELALDAGSRSGRCGIDQDGGRLRLQLTKPYFSGETT